MINVIRYGEGLEKVLRFYNQSRLWAMAIEFTGWKIIRCVVQGADRQLVSHNSRLNKLIFTLMGIDSSFNLKFPHLHIS
eukprot:gene1001-594_t